jgi:hypothetical protein
MTAENYFIKDQYSGDWVDVFTREEYKIVIADSLNYCIENKGLEVFAWRLMPNQLHFKKFTAKIILDKIKTEPESRRDWMLYRFEFAGKFDNRISKYRFWQDTNHAIQLDNTTLTEQKMNYPHDNPVRAMIVGKQEYYLYSSARDYAGEKGLVNVQTVL